MKTLVGAALIAVSMFGLAENASALAESFVGTYSAVKSRSCVAHTLTVKRSAKSVELQLQFADGKPAQNLKFVYGRSREISGGGQLQNFITAPNQNSLRLVRNETDYRNHPVSVLSILLTKTARGLKVQSVSRNASESPMNCRYAI